MGNEAKKKEERRHLRKLFGGKMTAEEVHRKYAFPPDARCKCGSKKVAVRARSFAPLDWVIEKNPALAMQIAARHEGQIPVVDFRGPGDRPVKYVRVGDAYACDLCKKDLEKAAAQGPSFVVVHFDYGPGPDKPVVSVE